MQRLFRSVLVGVVTSLSTVTGAQATSTSTSTTTTPVTASTTTPTTIHVRRHPPVPVAPLTGRPDPARTTHRRSAITVKIDNTPEARPQYGVENADVVYEEIVEGGITRLAAIFNSRLPRKVGPVRSVRRTDREIVYPVRGIFAFSGGAAYALRSIASAPVKRFDQTNAGSAMFRDPRRYAPHNLYVNLVKLEAMGGKPQPPRPLFSYARPDARPVGGRVASFTVGFAAGYATSYQWNGATRSWARSIFGHPDVTAGGRRVSPTNVVVMNVYYKGGVGVEGSAAQLTGSGPVTVFTAGRVVHGRWSRRRLELPIVYRSSSGQLIRVRPGQTWVELLALSEHVSVVPARP